MKEATESFKQSILDIIKDSAEQEITCKNIVSEDLKSVDEEAFHAFVGYVKRLEMTHTALLQTDAAVWAISQDKEGSVNIMIWDEDAQVWRGNEQEIEIGIEGTQQEEESAA